MATAEADVPQPVCETIREEEERKMVDQAANKVTKEEKTSTDNTPNEPPETLESNFDVKDVKKTIEGSASTIESENFLRTPLIAEVSFEAKNLSDACKITEKSEKITKEDTDNSTPGNAKLDDQPLEITGSEETILEGIKEKAEESNGKYVEKNMASVPFTVDSAVSTSATSAGDIIYGLDQEDITVENQMSKETSTEDDGTTNSFTKEMGSPEENLCETILQSRESKGSEIPNVSEVKNLNPEVTMPNDESGRVKITKDEIPCILITDIPTEGESSSDQNETVIENSEKNAEEMAGSILKSQTTGETSSENAVKEEMPYDGNKTTGLPILIETANEEIKERKNGDDAKNLSCIPLATTQIEEIISSEQVGLGIELHNIAEKASQEKILDSQTMTAVISHEYELQGENESESSFLKEKDDIHIQKCDKTVTTPEYSETIMEIAGTKSQEEIENQSKTLEENITIHTNPTGIEETEENALIQDDGSQMKHEVHLEKEDEKPCFSDASMRDTRDDKSVPKNEDEEPRKAELSENKKDMESISVAKEATMQKYTESLEVAPEEVESSISIPNTETTSSLEEKSRSANPQEILCDEVEQTFEAVDRTEETLKNTLAPVSNEETEENSTIAVEGSQMKGDEHLEKENKTPRITETLATDIGDNESTLEGKMKDADLRKDELIKNQSGKESALLKQDATMEKPIDSLQVAHEDIKASTSDDDTKPSSLENQILSENPQEILGDKTESKSCGVVDTKEETLEIQAVPTIESNDDNEDNSVIKEYVSEGKYEERLDKECEKPHVKEASIRDAIDDKSAYMEEDKFEDKDLRKAVQIENQTDIENTPLEEEATVMKPIESLQLDPEDIRTYASDHGTETRSLTASSQGNLDGITEDKAIENVTTVVSNEDIEEKSMIKVDGSQIKQEEYLEREGQIPFIKEVSTGKTSDDESIINHVDNTEHEDLRKAELLETEKNTESTLLKKETQMAIPIKSLQVVAEDIIAPTSCQDTEKSSQQERKLNAHENLGQQIENKTINAADTKEKTPEAQSVATIFSNENSQENLLIQMDESNIKHEELPEKEGEMLSLSETLVVENNNEEPKVIHKDKDAESTLLKGGLQVDKPIESLNVGFEDIEASVSCQNREATSSLMDQSMTANPNEIIGEQTEETVSDDTKEKTPEAQNFTTIVSNENAEKNSLIQVDASQKKHEELFENERKIPASSETLTVETNNQESTVIQEDKIADEDLLKVDVYQQEESTFLKEEAQLDQPIESLQAVPGDSKASTLCQDTETTSFLEKRSLTENPQEFEGDQAEDKIIDAADMKEKTSETHQNFATTLTNENTEENSQQQMDGSQKKQEELLNGESKIPFLSETSELKTNDEESKIINEDKNAEITLLKEEVQVGQPIESLQVACEAIEASVSCQDSETSSLRARNHTENPEEVMGGQTEDKIIGTADIKDKTPEAQNFTTNFSNDNAENNSLIEVDASQRKHEELFEKEREIPALSEALMAETNIKESIIIHEEKTEDENIKKVAEFESEKHIESTFLNEEAQVDKPTESWSIAPEDGKASASCQETETSFLKETSQTTNSQEIEGNQTEHKIIDAANTKERLPEVQDFATILTNENSEENSLLQMDGSQMKHEELLEKEREIPSLSETSVVATSNQESIIIHEKKYEDEDLKKNMFESEKHAECTLSKEEAHIGKPIESLQVAPEDNKASCQHIETTSSLVEQSLIANTQFGDQTETQVSVGLDTKEKNPEAQGLATVVSNEKTEENSLEKEREIPSFSEALIVETNNEEPTVMHEDKIEDKDLDKIDQFASKKHAESTLLKEEVQVHQPTKSLQAVLKEMEASVSCQDPETNSLVEQGITANPQEIIGDHQTEEKIIDTAETKEKALEVQISTKIASNENAEMNSLIPVGTSQKEHEDLFENEREIPASSEGSTVETNNQESTVIQEDKIEDEDLQKIDVYQQQESVLSKEEAQLDKPIESFQAPPGDSKASASGKDTETKGFLEEQILTENSQEIKGDQKEDKLIDAADTKEKTAESHNFAIAVTNENIKENSLLQMDCSKIKHEDLLNTEKIPSLSETLAVKTDNEELKIIHEDKDAGSTLLKEEVQVDQPIESLQVALEEIEASVPCQDPETINSLAEQSITANPQEIMGDQTEDKKIETADTKEKTLEAQISPTVFSNENSEKNSLIHVDTSLKKHEDLFVNEREIPALSGVSTVETNNQESTVIQNYKIEDEDLQKVHVYEQDKSTLLKEEAQLDKPIESLQAAPGDSKASASYQDTTETSFLEDQSLTKNPQEIEGDQTEDKIIDGAGTNEETSETHNFATIVTNENIEENSLLQMDGSKIKHEELLKEESEIPSLSEILTVKNNEEESKIIHEDKDAGSTLLKEEVQVNQPIESLQVALQEIEASLSCQDQEVTNSLADRSITANPQEIMDDQTEDKIIGTADTKEKTLEAQDSTTIVSNEFAEINLLIPVDASQKKHEDLFENEREIPALSEASTVETNNQESTVTQEDKVDDKDLQKGDVYEHEESTLLKDESPLDKPIESLQAPPEDSKASASWQDTETTGFLAERSLTENPQEIEGEETEDKLIDSANTKEKTAETHLQNFATIVTNKNIEENSMLQMDGSTIKHEELLNEESEIPSLSKTLAAKTNDEESIISHDDKDAGRTLLKEEVQGDQPIKSVQVALEEIEASVSCQNPEATNSLAERSITAKPQDIIGDQTEDKKIDMADTKEKTLEAQNSTTILSNENAEKNSLIQVDASQKKHEDLFENEREIPSFAEASTVETGNQVSTVSQENKIEDEDLQKVDVYEQEESILLKEEAQLDKRIVSLIAAPKDNKASTSCQDTETTSFLEERSTTENPQEIEGEQTEDKTIDAANTKEKTSETHNFATTVTNENIEENSLLQMDGSKIKHEELLNEEREIPSLSRTLAVKTIDEESKIIPDDKDAGSTLLKEEVQVDQPIESLQVALKEIEASIPYQNPETTCSLAVTRLTENTQEVVGGQTKDKIIDTADIKEKTPEAHNSTTIVSNEDDEKNSLIQADASQKKREDLFENEREIPALSEVSTGETNNEESIIIHEDKIEDQDVTKVSECESEKQVDSTFLHDEAQADKPIKSLNVAPKDSKESPSRQDTETSSFLEERSLIENPQEIAGDQIEEKTIDAAANTKEKTPYTHDCATIVTNDKTDDDSLLQMDGSQLKHEEILEKEREIPSSSETLVEEANNEESTIVHNDKFEDEDLKTVDMFEEKHAICSSSVEESHVDKPIESLQVASEDISASSQHLEKTSSPKEQNLTAYPQFGNQTEDKIYNAPDTKEKTCEAQGFTTVVSNENIEENEQMPVDGSQIIQEILETKREIPSLSETLTVKTNNEETSSIHEDKIEDEDLKNDDKFESDKYAESNLLKNEAWVHQSIESLQVAPEYIKAPAPCQDTETRSSLEDQSPTANPKEIEGDQAEAEIIDTADTKEKTQEAQDFTTITSNENAENNSLIQLGASQKKHEAQTESGTPTLSDTLMVESYTEKSTIIHEDNIEDKDLKKNDGHKNAEAQVDTPIGSLQLAHEDIKASPSCHDTEITSSLEERNLTANPQEIVCDQTEDRIIDAADTEEESPEAQDFATNVANDETEDNSLLEMDGSQLKHEELLEKEREIPSSSETLVQEASNEESTILHKDKSEDEDPRTVDTIENEKFIESTSLKEEKKVGKHVDSLQIAPEDIKASASCQERDTTSTLMEQSLTANAQETVSEQIEDKIIATADPKDKTPDALKKVTKIISNEEYESVIPCSKSTDLDVINQLKEEELNGDLLKDANHTHSANAATTQSESTLQEHVPAADALDADQLLPRGEVLDKPEEDCTIDLEAKLQVRATGSNVEEINQINDEASITELPNSEIKNDTSKVSMIEEVSSDVCMDKGKKERNSGENPEDQDGSVAPHGENDDQSKEKKIEANDIISGQIIGKKVLADNDEIQDSTIEKQMTENQDIAAQSEAVADEMINAFQEAPGEIQNIDSKAKTIETIEEEDYQKDFQMISALDPAVQDGKESDSKSSHSPETKSTGVDIETVVDIADDANCEKLQPSISEMLKKDAGVTRLASEASETNSDHKIVGEANDCHQKTDIQEIGVSDTGSIKVPINENQMEACSEESTEVQVPQGETKVEEMKKDPVVRSDQQDIEGHPKNVSHIVSETTGVRADNNSFEESSRQSLQEIGNKEPQEKYQDLENLAHVKDSSMEKTQKDVQLCVAITNDSSIIQEMQVPEEDYIPSPDENILDKMDHKESEAAEDATNYNHTKNLHHEDTTESIMEDLKHLEPTERNNEEAKCNVTLDQTMENTKESTLEVEDHSTIERDLTTDREEMHSGRTTKDGDEAAKIEKDDEEEEETGKENISDFSSKAPIMTEAKDEEVSILVYEAVDENFTSGVAEESNILNGITETPDSKVMKREETQKDTLDSVKSIEGLEIISHDEDPEIQMTASKVIEVQEVGNLSASETSVLVSQSERANFDDAQIGSVTEEKSKSNEIDFAHRESTAMCEFNDQGVNELKSREITTIENNSEKNGKEINRDDGTGYKTKSESVEEETQDDLNYVPEKQELQGSVLLSKELPFKPYSKMEKITYDGEANEERVELGEEEKLKDVVNLNYNARKKEDNDTVNSISESSETVEPENMEVVTETVAQVQNCALISKVEDPITKEDKLEEAAAEVKSDKIMAADTLSRKETMKVYILTDEVKEETEDAKNYQEDEEKPEEDSRINTEELFETIQNANENKKVPKVLGEADATDSINEQIVLDDKVVEEPNENIQANEPKDGSLQQQENEKNVDQATTGLDTKEKEHELDHQIEKTSIEDPKEEVNSSILVFQEEEYNRTGANGTNNVVIKDAELVTMNNKNTNTTMIELQEDHENKQGSLPLSEVLQVQESEKQDKNDEIFSSDTVQGKEEEKVPMSASKSDVEADKVDNLSRLTEDENNKIKIEVEKLDFSSHTKDASEISQNDHNSNENVEAKVSNGGKEADIIQQDVVSNTVVKQEIQEKQLANTVETVLEEKGMNSEEDKIKNDSCNDLQENSSSVDTDKVAQSNILQGSIGEEAEGAKSQEKAKQCSSLPILPHVKCSDMEIAQKDITLHLAKQDEENLKELEASPLPTTDKPIVLEADHTDNANTNSPISSDIPMLQHGDSSGSSLTKGEKQEPSKFEKEEEKCKHEETAKPIKTEQSTEIDKNSLSYLLQLSGKETLQSADHFIVKPTIQKEDLQEEKSDEAAHEDAKTDEEKDYEEELSEHKSSDMSSDAPVMVDAGDTDVKVAHKKSHNILSGVGSKVKHSIAKVKKAITGKSSHPKSHSPKYGEKI